MSSKACTHCTRNCQGFIALELKLMIPSVIYAMSGEDNGLRNQIIHCCSDYLTFNRNQQPQQRFILAINQVSINVVTIAIILIHKS